MMDTTRTLRPGLLVSLKTKIVGGVQYDRAEIEAEHLTEAGTKRAKWETVKTIEDPKEHELATAVRGKCRSVITSICADSEFGMLCPVSNEGELDGRVDAARRLAAEFNAQSRTCRIEIYVLAGRIAPDDVEAARAIASEVRSLLRDMEDGIKGANPEAIRAAAKKAKSVSQMLSAEVQGKVTDAVAQAREAAKEIARRVLKDSEPAERVVQEIRTEALSAARFAFLDLDAPDAVSQVATDLQSAPALDLMDPTAPAPTVSAGPAPKLEV